MRISFGSRESALARWQTGHAGRLLEAAHPGTRIEVEWIQTTGDRITDVPLAKIGDKGLFTKELDRAILDGRVDAAVHSLKDVPTRLDPGLEIGAILEREDPRDAWIPAPGRPASFAALPAGATVGTSSLRRRSQLLHLRPDLEVVDLRGNLDTRMDKVRRGAMDAIILALAGLRRLGWEGEVGETLDPPTWLPAAGQGAIAVVMRAGDSETAELLAALDHAPTRAAVAAERTFLAALEGGCQIPIGALAGTTGGRFRLAGFVGSIDGRDLLRGEIEGSPDEAVGLGERLARELIGQGADTILRAVRGEPVEDLPRASAP